MKPELTEQFLDNGTHANWTLTDLDTGNVLWQEWEPNCIGKTTYDFNSGETHYTRNPNRYVIKDDFKIILVSNDVINDTNSLRAIEKELGRQLWSRISVYGVENPDVDIFDIIVISSHLWDTSRLDLVSKLPNIQIININKILELKPGIISTYLNGVLNR